MEIHDIIVIGGGPAGLFAGINSSDGKKDVLILEKNKKPGRKLLLTGGGRCNLTHLGDVLQILNHYGENGKFLKTALFNFSNQDLINFFKERGLDFVVEEDGKVFPASGNAMDVLNILMTECEKRQVDVKCDVTVRGIGKSGENFYIFTDNEKYLCRNLIVATGGMAYPATGSTGDGYIFAKQMGHTVTPIKPALTPLYIKDFALDELAGVSFKNVCISLWRDNKKIREFSGDLLITHRGISGPVILNSSRYVCKEDMLKVNFMGIKQEQFQTDFFETVLKNGGLTVKSVLKKYPIPKRLIDKVLQLAGIFDGIKCAELKKEYRKKIVELLTEFPLQVEKLGDFNVAMVTKGGVCLKEINPKSMESRLVKGLYFVGEVLDIDGETGGYNLQMAFSTGYLAACSILS